MSITAATLGIVAASAALVVLLMAGGQMQTKLANQAQSSKNNSSEALLKPDGPPVQFVLFTRNYSPVNLDLNKTLKESPFNFDAQTKVIVHGFLSSIKQEVFTLTRDAYLSQGDFNVIGVDWSVLCEFEYFSAMKGAQKAGKALADFLEYLLYNGVDYGEIHLIGHSLGAHVAGIGSDAISGGKIARITGLDPAGPGFSEVSHDLRLDPGDAQLVDIIHTYMRVLSLTEPVGHIDFYPNGGRFQPGCPEILDIWKVPESISCNHGRSYLYFLESIKNDKAFKSQRCGSVEEAVYGRCFEESDVYMGNADTYVNGIYYVRTKASPPFSLTY